MKEPKVKRHNLISSVVSFSEIIDVGDKYKSLIKRGGSNNKERNNRSQNQGRLATHLSDELDHNYMD